LEKLSSSNDSSSECSEHNIFGDA